MGRKAFSKVTEDIMTLTKRLVVHTKISYQRTNPLNGINLKTCSILNFKICRNYVDVSEVVMSLAFDAFSTIKLLEMENAMKNSKHDN